MHYRQKCVIIGKRTVVLLRVLGEVIEPTDFMRQLVAFCIANGVPNAGEPMSYEREGGDEKNENGGTVLAVSIYFTCDAHKTQKASSLEQAYERGSLS